MLLGIITRFAVPHVAVELTSLDTAFVNLIKMVISSIIICTDVPNPHDPGGGLTIMTGVPPWAWCALTYPLATGVKALAEVLLTRMKLAFAITP